MMFPKSPRVKDTKIITNLKKEIRHCEYCGSTFNTLHAHHIKTVATFGSDSVENCIVLCFICHEKAHKSNISKEKLREVVVERNLWYNISNK